MPRNNAAAAEFRTIGPRLLREWPLPEPAKGDKEARGRTFVVAGCRQMPGPVILAATAALRAGAGTLQIGTGASIALHVAAAVPEALVAAFREHASGAIAPACASEVLRRANAADALVFGPGMASGDACGELLAAVLARLETPVVLDAAALAFFSTRPEMAQPLCGRAILTPHAGEMAAMLRCERAQVEADPIAHVRQAVRRFQAVVALKGAVTYVATPEGELYCNRRGHVGLATSGSGDTLAGIIGGLLGRGATPAQAAVWGVFLHAQAGLALARRMGIGFLAREIPAEIPPIMRRLNRPRSGPPTVRNHRGLQ